MHTRTLKKLFLALTFWLALHTSALKAQTLPISYSGTGSSFGVDTNGLLSAVGTNGTGSLSLSGAGNRMFWYPGYAAFRAGNVGGTQWDSANIGWGSVAFGVNTTASGWASTAFGYGNLASMGSSTAMGQSNTASGPISTAMGGYSTASGYASTVLGHQNYAGGNSSVAGGFNSQAWADFSTALGYNLANSSYTSFVVGRYNSGGGISATSWNNADPLFEVGNGTSTTRADALIVYKNGNATVQGVLAAHTGLTCPQQGDLSMGSFTAGTAP